MYQSEDHKNVLILWLWAFWIANLKHLDENIDKNKFKLFWIDKKQTTESIKNIWKHDIWFKDIDYKISKDVQLFPIWSENIIENMDIIIIAIPSNFVVDFIEKNKENFRENVIIVNLSKALSKNNRTLWWEIWRILIDKKYDYIALSWGMIASDFIEKSQVWFTIAWKNKQNLGIIYDMYFSENLYIEKSDDILGVEMCWSLKNLASIYIWYLKGKWSTYSHIIRELSLIWWEIKWLAVSLWAKEKTFAIESQCFWNDFIMSATWETRNALFWEIIWWWKTAKQALKEMDKMWKIVEWIKTAKSIKAILKEKKMEWKFERIEKILNILKEAI